MPTQEQLEAPVRAACDRLERDDRVLFERDVNERSFSHKFAMYLQAEVDSWGEGWDVDCEFNRSIDQPRGIKMLDLPTGLAHKLGDVTPVNDIDARTVFPDVIVHRRGPGVNLLVVEVKKTTATPEDIDFDWKHKLREYVKTLKYKAAVLLLLDLDNETCVRRWYRKLKK
jgi:hypothetical protein